MKQCGCARLPTYIAPPSQSLTRFIHQFNYPQHLLSPHTPLQQPLIPNSIKSPTIRISLPRPMSPSLTPPIPPMPRPNHLIHSLLFSSPQRPPSALPAYSRRLRVPAGTVNWHATARWWSRYSVVRCILVPFTALALACVYFYARWRGWRWSIIVEYAVHRHCHWSWEGTGHRINRHTWRGWRWWSSSISGGLDVG
jgi:hypothetical protein